MLVTRRKALPGASQQPLVSPHLPFPPLPLCPLVSGKQRQVGRHLPTPPPSLYTLQIAVSSRRPCVLGRNLMEKEDTWSPCWPKWASPSPGWRPALEQSPASCPQRGMKNTRPVPLSDTQVTAPACGLFGLCSGASPLLQNRHSPSWPCPPVTGLPGASSQLSTVLSHRLEMSNDPRQQAPPWRS